MFHEPTRDEWVERVQTGTTLREQCDNLLLLHGAIIKKFLKLPVHIKEGDTPSRFFIGEKEAKRAAADAVAEAHAAAAVPEGEGVGDAPPADAPAEMTEDSAAPAEPCAAAAPSEAVASASSNGSPTKKKSNVDIWKAAIRDAQTFSQVCLCVPSPNSHPRFVATHIPIPTLAVLPVPVRAHRLDQAPSLEALQAVRAPGRHFQHAVVLPLRQ